MKLILSKDEAFELHKHFYEKDYVVAGFERSGQFDYLPMSLAYGISDIGCWPGLISTDGEKIVITKEGIFNADKMTGIFTFYKEDIQEFKSGFSSCHFILKKDVKGLTRKKWIWAYLMIFTAFILTPLYLIIPGKFLKFRISESYKTRETFLEKLSFEKTSSSSTDFCKNCNKKVEDNRNILMLIIFFPLSLFFVKKRCQECGSKV